MNREEQRTDFLNELGLGDVELMPLAQDASTRSYFRISGSDQPLMLMDAPPATEKPQEFIEVTDALLNLGARVPTLYASDAENGFILLEDLGDRTFSALLAAGSDETALYQNATDALIDFQRAFLKAPAQLNIPVYDLDLCLDEACYFIEWYLPAVLGRPLADEDKEAFIQAFTTLYDHLPINDMVLVHRDFHVDNLLMSGRKCALLDYQDAVMGWPAYDLVSLLEDARRDVDPGVITRMRLRWQNRHGFSHVDTEFAIRFWGAQRHCKVAGIFVRLWLRDGKPQYLVHLDRVLSLLAESLNHPEMQVLDDWVSGQMSTIQHRPFPMAEHELQRMLGIATA